MPITWREQMSVGIEEVDNDHRRLIDIINDFEASAQRGAGQVPDDNMRTTLRRLQQYARDHFAREEKMQGKAQYAGMAENRIQHVLLLDSLNDFIVNFSEGKLGPGKVATDKMTEFLRRWLVDHILKVDLKMKGQINLSR
jgi:hemerythrin